MTQDVSEQAGRSPRTRISADPFDLGMWSFSIEAQAAEAEDLPTSYQAAAPGDEAPPPWESFLPPPVSAGENVSFGPGGEATQADLPPPVWELALSSTPDGALSGTEELERRQAQVQAIGDGLDQATADLNSFLYRRSIQKRAGNLNYGLPSFAPGTELSPEETLALALAEYEPVEEGTVNYAAFGGIDWNALRQSYEALVESVNRQVLHMAWVDTTLDGHIAARSMVRWGGDMCSYLSPGASQALIDLHNRSLAAALASRETNLRTLLTVAVLAGKIAMAPSNPMQLIQALSLAWQFIQQTILPLLRKEPGPA